MVSSQNSKSKTRPTEHWLPGQQAYTQEFVAPLQRIYRGEWTDPYMLGLQRQQTEAAEKEARMGRQQIAGSGLSTPGKAKALQSIQSNLISSVAGVPAQIWQTVAQTLAQYALTPPQIGQKGESKSQGWGVLA